MSLIKTLIKDENARKIFGKREIKIIEKQLRGITLTQSEKNRLSRDIRKKLDFIKKISAFSEEFELKKGAEVKNRILEAKEEILKDKLLKKIKRIFLFGSAAQNQITFRSDIDLAVEFSDITLQESTLFRMRVSGRVSSNVDIQVYNVLPSKIKKEIDEKGKVIYESTN